VAITREVFVESLGEVQVLHCGDCGQQSTVSTESPFLPVRIEIKP
jgi:hypothetical protein